LNPSGGYFSELFANSFGFSTYLFMFWTFNQTKKIFICTFEHSSLFFPVSTKCIFFFYKSPKLFNNKNIN